jgi:phosphoserine phosphatase
MQYLVIQGRALGDALLQNLATAAGAQRIDQRGANAARLLGFAGPVDRARVLALCDAAQVDCAFVETPRLLADFRLAVFDMDSTMITIECIDEIADMLGIKPQVAAITESAMRGEIAFPESLRRRVALLGGLDTSALQRVYDERLQLSPGAETMLAGLRKAGLKVLLVSGGFTFFTERLQARLGLDYTASNTLGIENGKLTGEVVGPIVDADAKAAKLIETCALLGCTPAQAIAVGDGANDLKMMAVAGVSVAYRAKPVVRAQAMYGISHNGLDALLELFERD